MIHATRWSPATAARRCAKVHLPKSLRRPFAQRHRCSTVTPRAGDTHGLYVIYYYIYDLYGYIMFRNSIVYIYIYIIKNKHIISNIHSWNDIIVYTYTYDIAVKENDHAPSLPVMYIRIYIPKMRTTQGWMKTAARPWFQWETQWTVDSLVTLVMTYFVHPFV